MIADGQAFVCIALATGLPDRSAIAVNFDNFGVTPEPPFSLDEYFEKVLGTIQCRDFRDSKLFLIATKDSIDPTPTAAFDRELELAAKCLLYTLLMFGYSGTMRQSLIVAGKCHSGRTDVYATGELPLCRRRFG
jgi:hypothetical protein